MDTDNFPNSGTYGIGLFDTTEMVAFQQESSNLLEWIIIYRQPQNAALRLEVGRISGFFSF